jgi:hypothetical protein
MENGRAEECTVEDDSFWGMVGVSGIEQRKS